MLGCFSLRPAAGVIVTAAGDRAVAIRNARPAGDRRRQRRPEIFRNLDKLFRAGDGDQPHHRKNAIMAVIKSAYAIFQSRENRARAPYACAFTMTIGWDWFSCVLSCRLLVGVFHRAHVLFQFDKRRTFAGVERLTTKFDGDRRSITVEV